jgi:putative heme-binding domain-containing protein
MTRLHRRDLPAPDRTIAVESVRNASSDIRGLYDDFIPESQRKKTLGRTFEPSRVLSLEGDALRGRLIFFSDAARCRNCHHQDDAALSVGPTLADISRKYMQSSELLQHIVMPSQKIEDKYATWIAVTNDGRSLNGLVEQQTDEQIVIKMADRQLVTVSKSDLEDLQKSTTSLMPEGVLADLTADEAADLFAFIRTLSGGTLKP